MTVVSQWSVRGNRRVNEVWSDVLIDEEVKSKNWLRKTEVKRVIEELKLISGSVKGKLMWEKREWTRPKLYLLFVKWKNEFPFEPLRANE